MSLEVQLLGTLSAHVDGAPADLGGPRQRAVLALLLVARGAVVSVDRLIDDLWEGEAPRRASASLQAYISNLRRAIEPSRAPRAPATVLISAPPGYAVRLPERAVDAWDFEQLLRAAASEPRPRAQIEMLERALGRWRGEALAEFATHHWAEPEAARLTELRWAARERLVDARIRAGHAPEAVVDAEGLVRDGELREEGWRLLALAHYAAGRQGDALATLRRARRVLSDELGIEPGPRLAALHHEVLTQSVVVPEPSDADAPGAVGPTAGSPTTPAQPHPVSPWRGFVGRQAERAAVHSAAEATSAGAPAAVLVAGEAGAGKSALLAQLRHELLRDGWRVALGRCPEDAAGAPAAAWLEALHNLSAQTGGGEPPELARFLSLDSRTPARANLLVERFLLHRAIADWLASHADRPLAVLLDDVHRADGETRALLASLLDRGLSARLLFVLAYRPEPDERLDEVLATVAHHAPARIRLGGLARDEAAELIAGVTGRSALPAVVRALSERTDGNPFYLTESARLLASEGTVVATSQVPEGVADVLRRRLARLPANTVSTLRLAALIGRDADVSLLVRASDLGEGEVLDALEGGVIAGLLTEPTPGTIRFSHLLVRETLCAGTPDLRLRRWYGRLADAVAELRPGDITALAHYSARAATPDTARTAARRCVAAAELAESRFAFDAAAQFYGEAQHSLGLLLDADIPALVEVMTRRVPALIRAGRTIKASRLRHEAAVLAASTNDTSLLARAVNCGTIPAMHGDLRAYGSFDAELVALLDRVLADPTVADAARALTLTTFVTETTRTDDPRTEPAYVEACAIAARTGDPVLLGLARWAGAELFHPDRAPQQRAEIVDALNLVGVRTGLPVFQVVAHVMAVSSELVRVDIAQARRHLDSAAELSRRFQLRQGTFISNLLRAMLAHVGGDPDLAEQLYETEFDEQAGLGSVDIEAGRLIVLATLRYNQARLAELVEPLRHAAAEVPVFRHVHAFALAESGALAEARTVLDTTPSLQPEALWQLFVTMRALTVAAVGDHNHAPVLYEQLRPFAHQIAGGGTNGIVLVPVGHALGRLAVLLGDRAAARHHFEQALTVAQRCGSTLWVEQALSCLADVATPAPARRNR